MSAARMTLFGRRFGAVLLACLWPAVTFAAAPTDEERRQIDRLIFAYYVAVAAENVDEVVDLHHSENSFERNKIEALAEQAFAAADSEFERVRIQSIDLFPERGIGLVRVGVDYVVRSFDASDSFSGHIDAAIVLKRGSKGWRIGKVGRAADFDLTNAVSQIAAKSRNSRRRCRQPRLERSKSRRLASSGRTSPPLRLEWFIRRQLQPIQHKCRWPLRRRPGPSPSTP